MIVETAREIQAAGNDLTEYLRVIGVPVSTFGFWAREAAEGKLVPKPPRPPTLEETSFRINLSHEMKQLAHRRHITFGLHHLWVKVRGRITRDEFRKLATEVRREANRERLAGLLRYEFTHPDVAHSVDFVTFPRELQYGARRYMIRILDDCTRCTLRQEVTLHKGAGVGGAFLHQHLKAGLLPLVLKYDREFAVPQFENILLHYKVVPLPSACASPWTNGKNERANGDVQQWIGVWGKDEFWTTEELRQELAFCFEGLDEIAESAILNGKIRRKEYDARQRAPVDRDAFFKDAVQFHGELLRRPNNRLLSNDAWRVAAKETLKKYDVVRYPRPSGVSGDFPG